MSVIVKNVSGSEKTYGGQAIANNGSYTIQEIERPLFSNDEVLLTDIGNSDAVINDGTNDLSISDGIDYLKGYNFKPKLDSIGNQITATEKISGKDFMAAVSHDFTDETTWFQGSTRVTGETLSGSGTGPYTSLNGNWIDLTHGKHSRENDYSASYVPVIYDNGVEVTTGITIDYVNGSVTFGSAPTGLVTADYSYAGVSTWSLVPDAGKVVNVEHAELDFSLNTSFTEVYFQIWAYNPADLPNKMIVEEVAYKNMKDILKIANEVTVIPALSGLTQQTMRAVFDYGSMISLKSSQGIELRIAIKDDAVMTGEFGTITLYTIIEDE